MSIEDIKAVLDSDVETFGSVELRKPTAGTLSLCDFAQLKIATGGATTVPFFEAIAFFYIHSQPLELVREILFDKSQGVDENGCSLRFINSVIDWGDNVELGGIGEMGEKIAQLLQDALTPKVQPSDKEKNTEDELAELTTDPKKN
jgi:hypothetical protein